MHSRLVTRSKAVCTILVTRLVDSLAQVKVKVESGNMAKQGLTIAEEYFMGITSK